MYLVAFFPSKFVLITIATQQMSYNITDSASADTYVHE